MNNKGEISGEVLFMIPKIVFMIAVLFAVILLVKAFLVSITDVREVEANILVKRILNSDKVAYVDEDTGRIYPGIVSLEKLSELSSNPNLLDTNDIHYGPDNPIIAARITIHGSERKEEIFYNKERFDRWEPRAIGKSGAGSVKSFEMKEYVLLKSGEEIRPVLAEFLILG